MPALAPALPHAIRECARFSCSLIRCVAQFPSGFLDFWFGSLDGFGSIVPSLVLALFLLLIGLFCVAAGTSQQ
ncbi:MAG: hypothetical protein WA867_13960 [Candidatus Acidiferrales bacterium]